MIFLLAFWILFGRNLIFLFLCSVFSFLFYLSSNCRQFSRNLLNSDIFGDGSEGRTKYSLTESDYSASPSIWNPYGLDLSSLGRDSSSSGSSSSYTYDSYNPKYNNEPEDQYYETYRLVDWDGDYPASPTTSSHRHRGTSGSDMYSSGSSHRSKKTSSPSSSSSSSHDNGNSKRAVTKLKPKPKVKNSKRISHYPPQGRELDRDLVPPPPAKKM